MLRGLSHPVRTAAQLALYRHGVYTTKFKKKLMPCIRTLFFFTLLVLHLYMYGMNITHHTYTGAALARTLYLTLNFLRNLKSKFP
jgi:hypothetical protein